MDPVCCRLRADLDNSSHLLCAQLAAICNPGDARVVNKINPILVSMWSFCGGSCWARVVVLPRVPVHLDCIKSCAFFCLDRHRAVGLYPPNIRFFWSLVRLFLFAPSTLEHERNFAVFQLRVRIDCPVRFVADRWLDEGFGAFPVS